MIQIHSQHKKTSLLSDPPRTQRYMKFEWKNTQLNLPNYFLYSQKEQIKESICE